MSERLNIQIDQCSFHRNGICGEGFSAVLFTADLAEGKREKMLGIVFDGPGQCAVVSLDRIEADGVTFGLNSYRGDNFEKRLREAIDSGEKADGARIGPFGMPTDPRAIAKINADVEKAVKP